MRAPLALLAALLLLGAPQRPPAGDIHLTWDNPLTNTDGTPLTDLDTLTVYRGSNGEALLYYATVPAPLHTFVDAQLAAATYCYEVTALNRQGEESAPSNQLCVKLRKRR